MPQIHILSPHVADLIAAGEVVERPASAVKELMENAFDAGARSVIVEIRGGGRELLRVTDDGCGMTPEDAGVCFLRHATSKLRDARDLEAIGTLGFRGEALAAISSVARITLTTRVPGTPQGVRVELTAGEIDSMTELGCPEGSTIAVRNLFYNTPARLKFLGSDRSEGAACVQTALRSALGRPELSVRCIKDGEEVFFSPGDGRMDSCAYALLGRETALDFLSVDTQRDGVAVRGFVSAPEHCRGNRSGQFFFCNGRPIRSRTLQAALEQAYKNTAMVGRFPGCVLYITLSNGLVDVNVHPTKAEVRFSREKAVFDGVYYGTLAALGQEDKLSVPLSAPAAPAPVKAAPRQDFFRSMTAGEYRESTARRESAPVSPALFTSPAPPAARPDTLPLCSPEIYHREGSAVLIHRESPAPSQASAPTGAANAAEPPQTAAPGIPPVAPAAGAFSRESADALPPAAPEQGEQTLLGEEFGREPCRFIGEALGVYILLEQGDKLILVDKHAAHERALFDRLRLNEQPLMSQELLAPQTLRCDPEGVALAVEHAALLAQLGFVLEPFGEDSLVLRAVPADIDTARALPLAEELLEKLREGRSLSAGDIKERLAETVACKAAIKGGRASSPEELLALAEKVLRGDVKYCPHGRPVAAVFTRSELDKRFGRIV